MRQIIAIILALVLVIAALTLVSCGKKENKKTDEKSESTPADIDPEILKALEEVSNVTPKKVIATQVVAGLNYAVLCDSKDGEVVCIVYKNLKNEYKYTKTMPKDEFCIPTEGDEKLCGGWQAVDD